MFQSSKSLAPLALMLMAAPAAAQQFDPIQFLSLQDQPGQSGTGTGTLYTPAFLPGHVEATLFDGKGVEQYTMTLQLFTEDEFGPGTRVLHGSLDGFLYPYKLTILPSEPEPDAVVSGEWYLHENGTGHLSAMLFDRGAGLAYQIIGVVQGTFQIDAEGDPIANLIYNPYGYLDGSASSLGATGFQIQPAPDSHVDPPPAVSNEPDRSAADGGNGQSAGGMNGLSSGSAQDPNASRPGMSSSAQQTDNANSAGSGAPLNPAAPQSQNQSAAPQVSSAQQAGSASEASGMNGLADYGDPQVIPDRVSFVPGPQFGRLELEWRIFD